MENCHDGVLFEVVVLHQGVVGLEDDFVLEVPGLLLANERVDEDAVDHGEGGLLDVLMTGAGCGSGRRPPFASPSP